MSNLAARSGYIQATLNLPKLSIPTVLRSASHKQDSPNHTLWDPTLRTWGRTIKLQAIASFALQRVHYASVRIASSYSVYLAKFPDQILFHENTVSWVPRMRNGGAHSCTVQFRIRCSIEEQMYTAPYSQSASARAFKL